jgi:hypothetical protein
MSDPIRAALDKAAEAVRVSFIEDGSCYGGDACRTLPCKCASDASTKAITAFLYAVNSSKWPRAIWLADAVLATAKEERE